MKRIRRVSLRVERREISITLSPSAASAGGEAPGDFDGQRPDVCPHCGAAWLPDFGTALREAHVGVELLQIAIRDRRLHLHSLPDGQFRVCERSFQTMREVL